MKYGGPVRGKKTVPERIRENRQPYYEGLQAADQAYEKGNYELTPLIVYLEELLKQQIADADAEAAASSPAPPPPPHSN